MTQIPGSLPLKFQMMLRSNTLWLAGKRRI
jgi:hypothetical protein